MAQSLLVAGVLVLLGLCGCLGLDTQDCTVHEFDYTVAGSHGHPNGKDTMVEGHVQAPLGEDPGIATHVGPICAYPYQEEWRTARFDDDGRHDEREGLLLGAVGPHQVWGSLVKNGDVLIEGHPEDDSLVVQVYTQQLYPFPELTQPITATVPIVCCHVYDTQVFVHNANNLDNTVYTVTIRSEETDEVFHDGPPPARIDAADLTDRLGARYEDTLVIELTSPQPMAPPPTTDHFFVVESNVPDESWPGSAPEPAPGDQPPS